MFQIGLAFLKVHCARGAAFAGIGLASPTIRTVLTDSADAQQINNPGMSRPVALAIPTGTYMALGTLAGPFTALESSRSMSQIAGRATTVKAVASTNRRRS